MQFVFCRQLFNTEKHVHFTTPDDVMTLILFKFLYCSFYEKQQQINNKNKQTNKKQQQQQQNTVNVLKISTHCFFLFFYTTLINAVAAQEHMM